MSRGQSPGHVRFGAPHSREQANRDPICPVGTCPGDCPQDMSEPDGSVGVVSSTRRRDRPRSLAGSARAMENRPDDAPRSRIREKETQQMNDEELETAAGPVFSRRSLLVKGGLTAAGLAALGGPTSAAFGATSRANAETIRLAVVTHGDTGSFWSVFKKGVDQATSDLKARGVVTTQVYANNDVAKQVAGINAAIAANAHVIATSVPNASALKGSLTIASKKNIEIITVNSGLGAFDTLPHYMVHVGQTEDVAGQGAGKQFKSAKAKKVLIVIHEASNSGLQQRADGVKKILGSGGVQVLTIPNAKSDIPGTKAKVQAAFKANKSLDGFLGLDPDVTIPCLDVIPKGTKAGTFDVGGAIKEIQAGRLMFAIDQQQYLQGYLPVVFAVLYVSNLNTVGNGQPVLTGPGVINKANAAQVAKLASEGTR